MSHTQDVSSHPSCCTLLDFTSTLSWFCFPGDTLRSRSLSPLDVPGYSSSLFSRRCGTEGSSAPAWPPSHRFLATLFTSASLCIFSSWAALGTPPNLNSSCKLHYRAVHRPHMRIPKVRRRWSRARPPHRPLAPGAALGTVQPVHVWTAGTPTFFPKSIKNLPSGKPCSHCLNFSANYNPMHSYKGPDGHCKSLTTHRSHCCSVPFTNNPVTQICQ